MYIIDHLIYLSKVTFLHNQEACNLYLTPYIGC